MYIFILSIHSNSSDPYPYPYISLQPVVQKGLANAQSALDWVKRQVASGVLASSFADLVVMGCSAGSIG
ncbi:hypothetical protein EON63_13415 [archaeon]|nr:MAG: hypothetical protein EON63_13415 [archaeon]